MVDNATPHYRLGDPRPTAAEAPYTFFLPAEAEIAAVGVGDLVQLTFYLVPPGERYEAERMWVEVTEIGPDGLIGTLQSKPYEARMEVGETVRLERFHIITVHWKDPASAPPHRGARAYWDRCLVDGCVLDGSEPVEFIYREEPDMSEEDDDYPDSGWRIRGRRGEATDDEMDQREMQYVALGAVLNQDDSWLPLIDEPTGRRFLRNFETDEYMPEAD